MMLLPISDGVMRKDELERYEDAIADFDKGLQLEPDDA